MLKLALDTSYRSVILPDMDGSLLAQIRQRIVETRITQIEIERRSGLAQPAISKFVNGGGLQAHNIERVARAVGLHFLPINIEPNTHVAVTVRVTQDMDVRIETKTLTEN